LTDRAGWVYGTTIATLQPVAIESGLWCSYIMCAQFLRRHPVQSADLSYETHYMAYQKVYTDARVVHPTTSVVYYRVQGTRGWLADRDEHLTDMAVRESPTTAIHAMTSKAVPRNQIVMVDWILQHQHRDTENEDDGPYLRLTDGSGWLFEYKSGNCTMQSVPVKLGTWEIQILNPPVGVGVRTYPQDTQDRVTVLIL
jgi:hypothetical protein